MATVVSPFALSACESVWGIFAFFSVVVCGFGVCVCLCVFPIELWLSILFAFRVCGCHVGDCVQHL